MLSYKQNKIIYQIILFFLFLTLFFGNIISYLIFNDLTTFYHDRLDSVVVMNEIVGRIYSGNLNATDIFLNGELKPFYLAHLFKPFIILYSIFSSKYAYFLIEMLVKLVGFYSFYILSKKFTKDILARCIFSALYASSIYYKHLGFGTAVLPYLIYLIYFKKNILTKHIIITIFFGLNTDLVADYFIGLIIGAISLLINQKLIFKNFKKFLLINSIFYISALITSLNLIYANFFYPPSHRTEFIFERYTILESLINLIQEFLNIKFTISWTIVYNLPYNIIILISLIFTIFFRNKFSKNFLYFIILTNLIIVLFQYFFGGMIFGMRLSWLLYYQPALYTFLLFLLIINISSKPKKYLKLAVFFVVILFQINSSIVPYIKKNLMKTENYINIYTFGGYYMQNDYKKIKKIVDNNRVMTIGYDPLIAAKNNISVIDGYHNFYPLSYKKKFLKVIEKELKKNNFLNKYYQNWGSRVYCFVNDFDNIEIDFLEAKKLGAKYVISKYNISNANLKLVSNNFQNPLYVFKIN